MADEIQALTAQRAPTAQFKVPAIPSQDTLKTDLNGIPGVPDYGKARPNIKTSQEASQVQADLLKREDELSREIGSNELAVKQYQAQAASDIATQKREAAQAVENHLEEVRKQFPYPEFHPTRDNLATVATLYSVIGLIGMAIGGQGKMSSMRSLNAMTGMMKGWQQGRADLWKQEKEEFDKGMARTKAILDDAYKDADRAHKVNAYNAEEAQALANVSAAKLGGQVGKQILERQGIQAYFKYIDGVKKDFQHAEDLASRERQHKETLEQSAKQHKEDRDQRAEQHREDREQRAQQHKEDRNQRAAQHKQDMEQRERLAKIKAERPGGSSKDRTYAFNIAEAYSQASQDLVNVTRMASGTVMGNFTELGGKSGDSLKNGLTAAFGRKMTSQDARQFAQLVAGLDQNMARALGGGYATSSAKHMIEAYKQQLPREGDSPAVAALFLARFKQELGILADVYDAHPGATDRMVGKVTKYREAVDKAIPFNVNDVLDASRGSRATISDQFKGLATETVRNDLPVDNTPRVPAMPPGVPPEARYSPSQNTWWWQENGSWKSKKVD